MGNIFGIMEAESYSDAEVILKKQDEYKKYIDTHVENVIRSYNEICNKIYGKDDEIDKALQALSDIIHKHDDSKYGDFEFEPYRKQFFPIDEKEKEENEEAYKKAMLHHYGENAHHPEHWKDVNGRIHDMPLNYIIE